MDAECPTSPISVTNCSLQTMKNLVKLEYKRMCIANQVQKSQSIKQLVTKNRTRVESAVEKHFSILHNDAFPRLTISLLSSGSPSKSAPIKETEKCAVRIGSGTQSQKCDIYVIQSGPGFPYMKIWNPVQQNYAVEDQVVLTNIPYLGDDKPDHRFLEDLVEHYERGVHGLREDGAGFLNDQMFFELCDRLSALMRRHDISPKKAGNSASIPADLVFEAISEVFTDKGTTKDLKAKYADILAKRDSNSSATCTTGQYSNPDIESAQAVSATAEQTLHSFSTLFCRRCYKYDCYLHASTVSSKRKLIQKSDLPKPDEPCGSDCSLSFTTGISKDTDNDSSSVDSFSFESASNGGRGKRRKRFPNKKPNVTSSMTNAKLRQCVDSKFTMKKFTTSDDTDWSPADQSMFRALASVFGTNHCAISQSMDKTCQQVFNFSQTDHMTKNASPLEESCESSDLTLSKHLKRFKHKDWMRKYAKVAAFKDIDGALKVSTSSSYVPCHHDGPCNESSTCGCIERSTFCEKFCQCGVDCPNRFPGCRCKAHCDTKQCPCFLAVRECDPDLCPNCGADDFCSAQIRCNNVNIQRGQKKHILLAPSDVAGWGIFLKEAVEKNTFIAEYCGELISQDEAERRGKLYDKHMCSFLFNLDQDFVVDATKKGNKIRFANHSVNPNCVAKVMMVNGDHRIGIFSRCPIQAHEELFFDYRYGPLEQLRFVGIEQKSRKSSK